MINAERDSVNHEKPFESEASTLPQELMSKGYGARIAQARKSMIPSMSQTALGKAIGCSQSTIGGYETEEREPSLEDFEKIAHVTGYSPAWLAFKLGPEKIDQEKQQNLQTDRENLFRVVASIERLMSREGLRRSPEEKARLIVSVYDIHTLFPTENLLSAELERLLGIAKRP